MKTIYLWFTKRVLLSILIIHLSVLSFAANYYVSNTGNDSNSGLSTALAWKTLDKVNAATYKAGDQILFQCGDTFYGTLIYKNSGTSISYIKYGSYGTGIKPVITGFTTISGWTNEGGGIYSSIITSQAQTNMVTVDGINTAMGRYPNSNYLTFESFNSNSSITDNELGDAINWTGAETVIRKNDWSLDRCSITNHTGNVLSYTSMGSTQSAKSKYGYFIQNDLRTLDQFGEWYHNPVSGKFYMYFGSVNPTTKTVKVATLNNLLYSHNRNSFVTVDNLSFEGAIKGCMDFSGYYSDNLSIQNCKINFSGSDGIYLEGCRNTIITNNTINNSSGCGIYVFLGGNNNIISNTITNSGLIIGAAKDGIATDGIFFIQSIQTDVPQHSLIQYNNVDSSGNNGIYFAGNNLEVKNNFINYSSLSFNDAGGIYTGGSEHVGRIIEGNIVLNSIGNIDGTTNSASLAEGIYIDANASGVHVAHNTIANCNHSGIKLNMAHDITIENNTTFNNAIGIIFENWMNVHNLYRDSLYNNIFVAKSVSQYSLMLVNWYNDNNIGIAYNNYYARPIADNLSFYTSLMGVTANKTFEQWKTITGQDVNSYKSPMAIKTESDLQFEYNSTTNLKTITLSQPMIDVKGTKYTGSITIQPYSSVVLMKDANPTTTDINPPLISAFILPATSISLTVPITSLSASDNIGVTGYLITETASTPSSSAAGWSSTVPTIYTFPTVGSKTLYAWAKDASGNVSASLQAKVIISSPLATSFTFTGPSSGNVNSVSANFTVTPNNLYTGTITLTSSGIGSAGLSAKVITFSNSSSAQTFTITPTVAGSITLSPSNNGGITNPSSLTYTANAVVSGVPTSVVATAGNTTASITFLAPDNNGGSAITGYTVTSIPAGGTDTNAGSTSLTHTITGLTNGTSYTFNVKASNSIGTSVASAASNLVIPTAPVATTFTFTGPSSGTINSVSANFTVAPNNLFTGTITLTPSGAGSAGLTARVITFSNSSTAQTFTITPTVAGSITLAPTNSGILTNPANLTYTVNAVVPNSPTSVVATAGNGSASVAFMAPTNTGGSSITGYTVTSIPSGGTDINAGSTSLNHSITGLTNGTSYTFIVKATNSVGTSIASAASNLVIPTAPVATTFTFTGPTSGTINSASTNFTVTPNNLFTGTITLTPSGAGSAGLSAKVLTFSNSSTVQNFTITPIVAGSITLTPTNNGTLSNPANLTYTVNGVVPNAPTSVVATSGDTSASVTFIAPTNTGGSTITGFTVTSIPAGGIDANAGSTSLTHTITGLTNGTSYTFTVKASNSIGNSVASVVSNQVIPVAASVIIKQGEIVPSHFTTVWQGLNGLNHMNINVVSALLEDVPLSVDDEIAVFSGSKCVGASKLTQSIVPSDNSTFLTILASQDDGSGNGFIDNDTIVFKIWDNKTQSELQINAAAYRNDISTWKTNGKFSPGATAVVEIASYQVYTQSIELLKGYNMISTYVSAQNPSVSVVTKTLLDQGNLIKMQDETGNSFENWGSFGGWINQLGSLEETEGYKIQVANNCTLQVTGRQISMPFDISLKTGWNIISYPRTDIINAMNVFQVLIDQNKLVKVQDEAGNSIENWGLFGGWKNGIGNFIPGKAYKVKMSADAILTFLDSYPKSALVIAKSEQTEYYHSSVEGNGTDHMNINITGLNNIGLSVGDELAAFDGVVCVATTKITEANLLSGSASLASSFSTDTQNQNGFKVGDQIQISTWNKLSSDESKVNTEVITGQMKYEKNASVLVKMKSAILATAITNLNNAVKIDVFPNPCQDKVTVRFSEIPEENSRIEISDISGRKITSRVISGTNEEFNLDSFPSGLYLVKSVLGYKEFVQKLIVNK